MRIIQQMRKRSSFEDEIGVDVVKIGRSLYKKELARQLGEEEAKNVEVDERAARKAFENNVRRIE